MTGRRYLLYDHLAPWGIVAFFLLVGLASANGPPGYMVPSGMSQSTTNTYQIGYMIGGAMVPTLLGVAIGYGIDAVLRRGDGA